MPGGFAFHFGRVLVVAGVVIVAVGLLLMAGSRFSLLGLGRLPGDFAYKGKNFTFYFPLATCIIISVLVTVIFWVISILTRR